MFSNEYNRTGARKSPAFNNCWSAWVEYKNMPRVLNLLLVLKKEVGMFGHGIFSYSTLMDWFPCRAQPSSHKNSNHTQSQTCGRTCISNVFSSSIACESLLWVQRCNYSKENVSKLVSYSSHRINNPTLELCNNIFQTMFACKIHWILANSLKQILLK